MTSLRSLGHYIDDSNKTKNKGGINMKHTKKRWTSLFLCLMLLMSACFEQCHITGKAEAAANKKAIRNLSSMELVKDMTLGWNLGNSLDSCIADRDGDGKLDTDPTKTADETLWGNIKTTPEIFTTLKNQGFNAVRIPVTWRDHLGEAPNYQIDETWMNRVQEVVNYAYDQGMYVIINLHHDGGDDTDFGAWIRKASTDKEEILKKYTAIWEQIATRFQDYSDYLIFESVNEIGFDDLMEAEGYELLNEINQTFVDLIRSSGGNNAKRHLLIGGYWTDISATSNDYFHMPKDPQNRCILSLHYYTPWEFCTSNQKTTWGSYTDGEEMQEKLDIVKESFIDQGIPVIIGEFGVGYGTEADSRIRFCGHFISRCKSMGIPCFYWDNGEEFDRSKLEWRTKGLAEAMLQAAEVSSRTATPEPTKPVVPVTPTNSSIPNVSSKTPAVKISPVPSVGSVLKSTTGIYQVTKSSTSKSSGILSLKKTANKNVKQVTIPATVTINNHSYLVTSIQKNAFQGCKKLKKVTIGSNITKIGANAFQGCKKLKTLRVNTPSLKSVGKKSFHKIGKKPVIYVPGNKKKSYQKKLKIRGNYKKQILLNYTNLTVSQGVSDKKLNTLKVVGSSKKAAWTSANKKIATVNSKGLVQGISKGTTTITGKIAKKKLTCKVKVTPALPASNPGTAQAPTIAPTIAPTAAPTAIPTSAPTPKPNTTQTPKWTPLPLFTCAPGEYKNPEDVAVIKKLAKKYPNSGIMTNFLNSGNYDWDDDGRLIAINWGKLGIDSTFEISGLPALESISLDRCHFTELKITDCGSLQSVSCNFNSSLKKLDLSNVPDISSVSISGDMEDLTEVLIQDKAKIESLSLGTMPNLNWDFTPFSNLESLTVHNNNITELDLTSNKKLKLLNCSYSQLSMLKISEGIEELNCDTNSITTLDLSKSTNLRLLSCSDNQLSSLDLSNNKILESINVFNNELTELNISNNEKLKELQCEGNKLTALTLDSCPSLKTLHCNDNLLTNLNLSACTLLETVQCNNNCLTKLDLGEGKALKNLNCDNNQLEALELLEKKKLTTLSCANNQLTKLEVSSKILSRLECPSNQLTQLDISSLIGLQYLDCTDNKLELLNFNSENALTELYCSKNQLTSLNVDNMPLNHLNCSDNPLDLLSINGCLNLQHLNFYHTNIKSLDVSKFNDLRIIYCDSADILIGWKYLEKDADDIAAIEALIHKIQESYDMSDNNPKIDSNYLVSPQYEWNDGKLTVIHWDHCSLTGKLDFSGLKNLQKLYCDNNALEELDISGCLNLFLLDCRENKLTEIDATNNALLYTIYCDDNVKVDGKNGPIDIITPENS